jgi:hypothetical protein
MTHEKEWYSDDTIIASRLGITLGQFRRAISMCHTRAGAAEMLGTTVNGLKHIVRRENLQEEIRSIDGRGRPIGSTDSKPRKRRNHVI